MKLLIAYGSLGKLFHLKEFSDALEREKIIVKLVKEIRSYYVDELKSRVLVVLSERIKVQAQSIGFNNVHVARIPSDKGTIIEILSQRK